MRDPEKPQRESLVRPNGDPQVAEQRARQVLGVLSDLGSEQVLQRVAFRLTAGVQKRMWAQIVAKTDDLAMGLHLGELFGPMSNSVNMWAWSAGHPRVALELVSEYWNVASAISKWEIVEQEGLLGLRYTMLYDLPLLPTDVQFRLSALLTMLRWMAGPELRPVRVAFPFREPSYGAEFVRVFGCPIEWNHPASELWFDSDRLVPRKGGPHQIHPPLAEFWERNDQRQPAAEPSLVDQLEGIVEAALEQGEIGIKFAAPLVNMGERTLIRKLREEGTTYRALVERVRRDKVVVLLQDRQLTLKQIASALGYSNAQNFARAFQRWFGVSPRDERKGAAQVVPKVDFH